VYFSPDPFDACLIFGALAIWGIWVIIQGLRGNTGEWCGSRGMARWVYVTFGAVIQMPLLVYVIFLLRTGYFRSYSP
jgi:hypothetical protein